MLLEQLEGVAILLEVTGGEALVSRVEGGEKLLALYDFENLFPLTFSWVDTGGVVSANVEHHDGVVLGVVKILLEALEVETLGARVIVSVVLPLVTTEIRDSSMDGPGGVGDKEIDILVGIPLAEEGESETEGSSSRDGLATSDSVLSKGLAVSTVSELEALLDIGVDTLDGGVLVIHVTLEDNFLSAPNAGKDERLAIIVSVGSHTEENLLGVSVLLEGVVESENGICGGTGQTSPSGEAGSALANNLTVCTLDEASEH